MTASADSNTAISTIHIAAVNDAPVNTVPRTQEIEANTDTPIAGLAVADPGRRLRHDDHHARGRARHAHGCGLRRGGVGRRHRTVMLTGTLADDQCDAGHMWSTAARTTTSAPTH